MFWGKDQSNSDVGTALILGGIKDLRDSMDKRDERVREDMGEIRRSVSDLTSAVQQSQNSHEAMRGDVGRLADNVDGVKSKVDTLSERVGTLEKKNELDANSWSGPKRLFVIATTLAGGIGAILLLANYWSSVMSALTTGS